MLFAPDIKKDLRDAKVLQTLTELMKAGNMNEGTAYEFANAIGFPNVGSETFTQDDRYVDYWVTKQKEVLRKSGNGLDAYRGLG